jgi:hypothetical protein
MVAVPSVATLPEEPPHLPDGRPTGERAVLESKVSPTLLEAFDCWKMQRSGCKLVEDGTVEIELFLTEDSGGVIGLIKPLGLRCRRIGQKKR